MRALAEDNEVFVHVYMKSSQNAKNNMEKRVCWVPLPAMEETVFQSWSETRCKFSAWKRRQAHVWWKREREYHCCLVILSWFPVSRPHSFLLFHTQSDTFLRFDLCSYYSSGLWSLSRISCSSDDFNYYCTFPQVRLCVSDVHTWCHAGGKHRETIKNSAFPQAWSCWGRACLPACMRI